MSEKAQDIVWIIVTTIASLTAAIVVGMFVYYGFNGSFDVPESTRTNFWAMINVGITTVAGSIMLREFRLSRQQRRAVNQQVAQTQQQIKNLDDTIKNGGGERIGNIAGPIAGNVAAEQILAQLQVLMPQLVEAAAQSAATKASEAATTTVVETVIPVIEEKVVAPLLPSPDKEPAQEG